MRLVTFTEDTPKTEILTELNKFFSDIGHAGHVEVYFRISSITGKDRYFLCTKPISTDMVDEFS